MPSIYGKRHGDFMEKFFQSGHKTVFNREREFFGLHRNGFCFHVRILIKQMPYLEEGIIYVGMIKQIQSDTDFILTDMKGVIDSFSAGVTTMLNLPITLFKDCDINIQIMAPELINVFSADKKKNTLEKFKEIGGQKITFFVPKDFAINVQLEAKKNGRDIGKTNQSKVNPLNKRGKVSMFRELNKDLNKHNGIAKMPLTPQQLLQSNEYKECESKQCIKCEINDPSYGNEHKDIDPLKLRIFKLSGINAKRNGSSMSISSDAEEFCRLGSIARSNASIQIPGAAIAENHSFFENVMEINRNLINLMNNKEEIKKEKVVEKGVRIETQKTEKIPGNVMTTESHVETQEIVFNLTAKYTPVSKPEHQFKQDILDIDKNAEKTNKSREGLRVPTPQDLKKAGSQKFRLTPPEPEEQQKQPDSPITPRMELGNIIGPNKSVSGSNAAELNSVAPNLTVLVESESNNETEKGVARKVSSEKQIAKDVANSDKGIKDENADLTGKSKIKKSKIGGSFGEEKHNDLIISDDGELHDDGLDSKGKDLHMVKEGADFNKYKNATDDLNVQKISKGATERNDPEENVGIKLRHSYSNIKDKEKCNPSNAAKILTDGSVKEKQDSLRNQNNPGKDSPSSRLNALREEEIKNVSKDRKNARDRMRQNTKIICNAQYCGDDSVDLDLPEYHQTEDEIKLRRSLLAFERRMNREKMREEKNNKEVKDEPKKENDEEEEVEAEEKDEDDENEVEEKKEKEKPKKKNGKAIKNQLDDLEDDSQDNQSMTSIMGGNTMRSFFSLRAAIDEKFVPLSIRNMNCSAGIVFLLLLGISSISFS